MADENTASEETDVNAISISQPRRSLLLVLLLFSAQQNAASLQAADDDALSLSILMALYGSHTKEFLDSQNNCIIH